MLYVDIARLCTCFVFYDMSRIHEQETCLGETTVLASSAFSSWLLLK